MQRQALVLAVAGSLAHQLPQEAGLAQALNAAREQSKACCRHVAWTPAKQAALDAGLERVKQVLSLTSPGWEHEPLVLINAALLLVSDQAAEMPASPPPRKNAWLQLEESLQELEERHDPGLASLIHEGAQVGEMLRAAVVGGGDPLVHQVQARFFQEDVASSSKEMSEL